MTADVMYNILYYFVVRMGTREIEYYVIYCGSRRRFNIYKTIRARGALCNIICIILRCTAFGKRNVGGGT